jgi:hypothetical protein
MWDVRCIFFKNYLLKITIYSVQGKNYKNCSDHQFNYNEYMDQKLYKGEKIILVKTRKKNGCGCVGDTAVCFTWIRVR